LLDRLESDSATADLGDDLLGGLGPHEGLGVLVVVGDVVLEFVQTLYTATPVTSFQPD
jgi:hypothetical protein